MVFQDILREDFPEKDLWDVLKESNKPIILYGMGDGADKIISTLSHYGLRPSEVFASDEFVRGHSFRSYKVKKYSEILEEYDDASVLICFGARTDELFGRFSEIGKRYSLYAPDVPVFGNTLFNSEFFYKNIKMFEKVFDLLSDDESKRVFAELIRFKLSGKLMYLDRCESDRISDINELVPKKDNGTYLDLGAYNGDTVEEYIDIFGTSYGTIIAVEPDRRSFKKLSETVEKRGFRNVICLNCGIGASDEMVIFSNKAGRMSSVGSEKGVLTEFLTVDSLCSRLGVRPDYIKMDLEGEEANAILGAKKTLLERPSLLVSAYHRSEDLFSLLLMIHDVNPEYRFYLRKNKYVPAWDINLFAI